MVTLLIIFMTYIFGEKITFNFQVLFKAENPMKYYTLLNHVTDSFSQKMFLDNISMLYYFILLFFHCRVKMRVFFKNILLTLRVKVINKNKFTFHRVCSKL